MDTDSPADANIDSSLSLNPPAPLPSFDNSTSSATALDPETVSPSAVTATDPSASAFIVLSTAQHTPSSPSSPPQPQSYSPAKLFQATGDVRNLARSPHSPSGFTVSIFDRHIRSWVHNINFSEVAIRGQLYILWKTAWQDPDSESVREAIYDAAKLTRDDIRKDNNKWERNYSAARRRDWHPNFTVFYDDVFKRLWVHRIWPSVEIVLPEPPRFLAEMARKMNKNAGPGAGMNIHQAEVAAAVEDQGETTMNPVALRTLKLRIIELETMNQVLREELERSQQEKAQLVQENREFQARFEDIRQKLNVK